MPGAFQEWNWFNRAPTPEEVILTRESLMFLRAFMAASGEDAWVLTLDTAIKQLTYYAERERRN